MYKVSQKNCSFVFIYLFINLEIVTVDESEHINLFEIQGKLGSLVLNIQKIVQSANVNIDDLKQLLILSYPFEELKKEVKILESFSDVFLVVRKLCSPVNIGVLILIVDHFKLSDAALTAIQAYEIEEQNYRKKLLSATFAEELNIKAKLLGCDSTPECTIALKLKWSSIDRFTVKEFDKIVKNLFSHFSKYICICTVDEGCIFVTMCAPKQLMGALVTMAKTRLPYLHDIGAILLQIGDEIILDKREKKVYN